MTSEASKQLVEEIVSPAVELSLTI
jgi:hypothetical protein